ncbi:MAG: hypothetical protein ABIX01_12445 [Chitinophagaceae bacterium]
MFENCWAFYNGYGTSFGSLGDGNGFKAGGYGGRAAADVPNPVPRNTVRFCLAVRNKANGFYSNHHIQGSDWYNNSAYLNGINYNMLNRLADNKTDVPGYHHIMKNNLGFAARSAEYANINTDSSDVTNNYFNLPVKVSEADFISLDQSQLTAPRQADGSLPAIDFMKLKPGSALIDLGVNVGFPFQGKAPDLGYRENGIGLK